MPGVSFIRERRSSQNCLLESGSTPVVGSSRMRKSGLCTRAQQSESFCFIPPESFPAGRSAKGSSAVAWRSLSILAFLSFLGMPNSEAWKLMFSITESVL